MSHDESHECQELLQGLADHLDGETQSRMCQELRHHMDGCPNCRLVVETDRTFARLPPAPARKPEGRLETQVCEVRWRSLRYIGGFR